MLSMLLRAATIESKDTGGLPGAGVEDASNVENWDAKDVDEHELLSTVSEALDGSVFEALETDVVAAASDTLVWLATLEDGVTTALLVPVLQRTHSNWNQT